MKQAEFDRFADEYRQTHARNIRWSGEHPDYFAEYKVRDLSLYPATARARSILDFGSGIGTSVPWFRKYFSDAALTCIDVSERSLEIGRSRFPGACQFASFDGRTLPAADESFDLVFAACVLHHIEAQEQPGILREIRRVLKRDGVFAVFEHNPLNPLTVHAVESCEFDENAVLVRASEMKRRLRAAGFGATELRFRVFFPGALRALRPLESWLRWCPVGAQYSIFARRLTDA